MDRQTPPTSARQVPPRDDTTSPAEETERRPQALTCRPQGQQEPAAPQVGTDAHVDSGRQHGTQDGPVVTRADGSPGQSEPEPAPAAADPSPPEGPADAPPDQPSTPPGPPPGAEQQPARSPPPQPAGSEAQGGRSDGCDQPAAAAAEAAEEAARTTTQVAQQVSALAQQVSQAVQQTSFQRLSQDAQRQAGAQASETAAPPARAQATPQEDEPTAGPATRSQPQQGTEGTGDAGPPFVDIYESDEEIAVFCDLPGLGPEDIRLEGDKRHLRIVAERPTTDKEETLVPITQERHRRIERTIELPADAEVGQADATCENGVCTVRLPKATDNTIGVQ